LNTANTDDIKDNHEKENSFSNKKIKNQENKINEEKDKKN